MRKPVCEVRYTIPVVVVIVDGKITRVVVDDESAMLAQEVSPETRIILDTQEWPGWEFGF